MFSIFKLKSDVKYKSILSKFLSGFTNKHVTLAVFNHLLRLLFHIVSYIKSYVPRKQMFCVVSEPL